MIVRVLGFLSNRSRVLGGSAFAIGFLAIEALGFLILTRLLTSHQGVYFAGEMSMMLYIAMLLNVLLSSLGVVVTRDVAEVFSQNISDMLNNVWSYTYKAERRVLGVIILFGTLMLIFNTFFPQMNSGSPYNGLLFLIGVVLRGVGLISSCRRVGAGNIGADKGFCLLFSFSFYFFSVVFIQLNLFEKWAVPVAYLLSSMISGYIEFSKSKTLTKHLTIVHIPNGLVHLSAETQPVINTKLFWSQYRALLLTSIAGFFVTSGDVFIVNAVFDSKAVVSYSVASKLSLGVFSIAVIYPAMHLQLMSQAYGSKSLIKARKLWAEGLCVAICAAILGSFAVSIIYPYVAQWVTHGNIFVNRYQFSLFCISAVLMTITAANGWAIVGAGRANLLCNPTIIDAAFTLVLGYLGARYYGLFGLLASVMIAHLISTCWHFLIAKNIFSLALDSK